LYDSWEPSDTCLTFCSLATSIGTQRWSENPIERKHQLIGNHIVCEDSHWMAPSLAGHEIQQSAGSFNEIVRSRKFISTTVAAIAHACCWWVLRVSWSGYISVVQAWHEQVKWAPYSPRWQLECLAVVAIIPKHDFGRCSPVLQVLPSNIQKIFGLITTLSLFELLNLICLDVGLVGLNCWILYPCQLQVQATAVCHGPGPMRFSAETA